MNLPTSHDVLQAAADDAKAAFLENQDRKPAMRASRAGQPLLVLALEDFVIPKLPQLTEGKPERLEKRVSKNVSISMGYLFEKALLKGMHEDPKFAGKRIVTQAKFELAGITGTADILVFDDKTKQLDIIECKSLNVSKESEAIETKLSHDNWGYLTQACLYHAAAVEAFPDYRVKSAWKVYAKQSGFVFTVPLRKDWKTVVNKAAKRAEAYVNFQKAFEAKDVNQCLDVLFDFYDPLPVKGFFYGRLAASCGFHFNPWSAAVLDEDGLLRDDSELAVKILLEFAFGEEDERSQSEQVVLRLLGK